MTLRRQFVAALLVTGLLTTACGAGGTPPQVADAPSSQALGGVLAGRTITDAEWTEVVDRTLASVVKIEVEGCSEYDAGSGSGFFTDGKVITNRHVVKDATRVSVTLPGNRTLSTTGWSWSATEDLAWITFADSDLPADLVVADSDAVPGDLVSGIGFPLGGKKTAERGRLVEFRPAYEKVSSESDVMLLTTEALPGDSGGPIINTYGRVVGVLFAMDFQRNLTMAIAGSQLRAFLADPPPPRSLRQCD